MRFACTDVFLYLISRAPQERGKAERAEKLLGDRDLALSVQGLQEFYVQATRRGPAGRISPADAADLLASFRRFPVVGPDPELLDAAILASDRFPISYRDAHDRRGHAEARLRDAHLPRTSPTARTRAASSSRTLFRGL